MKVRWTHHPRTSLAGRFGGGWQWAFGFRASRRTLMLELLVGTLTITRNVLQESRHETYEQAAYPTGCPYCGKRVATIADEVRHMEKVHPAIVKERLRKAGLA